MKPMAMILRVHSIVKMMVKKSYDSLTILFLRLRESGCM